ncbi:MAG: hypothetical protein AABX02_00315 [archaeon]
MNDQPNPTPATNTSHENTPNRSPTTITIDQFLNLIQLRTAKITSVEPVMGKDKLYKIEIEVGAEKRTIVSGIRGWYPNPEELVGKTIAIVANLEPKKLGGIVSQGMLLAALDDEGKFSLLVAEKEVKSGAEIR